MSNVNPISNSLSSLWGRTSGSSSDPAAAPAAQAPTAAARAPADAGASYDHAVETLPIRETALSTVVARMDAPGAKLDQLQAAMNGPYVVNGEVVKSAAQFRMSGGFNDGAAQSGSAECQRLYQVAQKAGLTALLPQLQMGRGTPEALRKVTQALIDAGELPKGSTASMSKQIHDLQWKFGIGVDCAGYVYRAAVALHGSADALGLKPSGMENFTGLPSNPRWQKEAPADARVGDVVVLQGKGKGDPGHNLIVRSHSVATKNDAAAFDRWQGASEFVKAAGTVHVFRVDSSFGAGPDGSPTGGVRRDIVLFDPASNLWCTCKTNGDSRATVSDAPYDEAAVTGVFRPRGVM
jgi:hypothetical protein